MCNNNKYEIKRNTVFGRYSVAKNDLKQGELILTELPIFTGLYWEADLCCLKCYRPSTTVCKECQMVPLCKLCSCYVTKDECAFLKNSGVDKNFLFDNFNTATIIKCLLSTIADKTLYEKLLEMEDHLEARRDTLIWKFIDKSVVQPILTSGILKNLPIKIDSDLIQKICGIFDVNSFEIRGPMALQGFVSNGFNIRAIYPNSALLAHDCIGNTLVAIDSEYTVRIYASQPIKADETIYFNYTRSLLNTADRRQFLREGKYFVCNCKRCLDPTELGTHLSSIKCKNCDSGLCIFNKYKKPFPSLLLSIYDSVINCSENWKCLHCNTTVSLEEIKTILDDAKNDIQEIGFDLRRLEQANDKYSSILNPNHSFVIEMKQNMAALLRNICVQGSPSRTVLKHKFDLCSSLLPIIRILQPGISRLAGITLYEIYVPLVQLAQKNFDTKEITSSELLNKLIEAESLLKESINILIYEHISVPEGQLARRAFIELKEVRSTIEKFKDIVTSENLSKNQKNKNRKNKKK